MKYSAAFAEWKQNAKAVFFIPKKLYNFLITCIIDI